MAQKTRRVELLKGEVRMTFYCPGCVSPHVVRIEPVEGQPKSTCWTWNGDLEKPTFKPSVLTDGHDPKRRCHLFVTDGKIEFLADCHHALAGQTVEMEEDR